MNRKLLTAASLFISILSGQTGFLPAVDIKDLDGRVIKREELLNRGPVLIDFWALWCAPCLKAMPHLDELQSQYSDRGLTVLLVNIDSETSRSKVRRLIKTRRYRSKVALDPAKQFFRRLNGMSLPYTLLIARDGRITYRHTGFVPGDEDHLAVEVAKLFAHADVDSVAAAPPVQ